MLWKCFSKCVWIKTIENHPNKHQIDALSAQNTALYRSTKLTLKQPDWGVKGMEFMSQSCNLLAFQLIPFQPVGDWKIELSLNFSAFSIFLSGNGFPFVFRIKINEKSSEEVKEK